MGNCCTVESSVDWAGEDWGSLTSRHRRSSRKVFDDGEGGHHHHHDRDHDHGLMNFGNVEKERLLGALRASSDANGKVKIMISKKELAKLLGSGSDQKQQQQGSNSNHHHHASSAEQVLARLIYARDHYDHHDVHHRHWKPVLQSIPEVN